MLSPAHFAAGQKPEQEHISVKVIRVQRIRDERDGALWYVNKIVLRDKNARLYHVRSECIEAAPVGMPPSMDSPISCGRIPLPRAGLTYDVTYSINFGVQFGEDKHLFELEIEEIADCNGGPR